MDEDVGDKDMSRDGSDDASDDDDADGTDESNDEMEDAVIWSLSSFSLPGACILSVVAILCPSSLCLFRRRGENELLDPQLIALRLK